jgi:hypothetical protein
MAIRVRPGDAAAAGLLAAHHADRQPPAPRRAPEAYGLVPTDDSLGTTSRAVRSSQEFSSRVTSSRSSQRTPARAEEIGTLIAQLDKDRERAEQAIRWEEEGGAPTGATAGRPDLVGRDHRFGIRLELGADVHHASGALPGVGTYNMFRVARGTAFNMRLDWTRRTDQMVELNEIAIGGGITTRLVDARKFELAVGVASRAELRYGNGAAGSSCGSGASRLPATSARAVAARRAGDVGTPLRPGPHSTPREARRCSSVRVRSALMGTARADGAITRSSQ